MDYLIQQISIYMLVAFLIGAVYGWLIRSGRANKDEQTAKECYQQSLQQVQLEQQRLLEKIEQLEMIPESGAGEDWLDDYPLNVIDDIEPSTLSKLQALGITTTKQLFNQCADEDAIYQLASNIAVEDFVIQRWVSIADLLRVANIEADDASLLEATEIYSLSELSQQKPQRLREKLSKTNMNQQRSTAVPETHKLQIWIEHASHILNK